MRHLIAFSLALTAAAPAAAQVRVVTELALPSAPAVAPAAALSPITATPTLGSALAAPGLAAPALSAAPVPVAPAAAPAPVTAQAALIRTGAALTAASKENRDQGAVSRRAFDAAQEPAERADAVAAPAATPSSPALKPYEPRSQLVKASAGGIKNAAYETVEVAAITIPFALISLILKGAMSNPMLLIPSMLALWALGAWTMRDHLGRLRSVRVGGWQASHDQKYRTDYATGRLRDIRGHKYGEDRYDEMKNGPVGRRATALIGAASALAAAAFLLL